MTTDNIHELSGSHKGLTNLTNSREVILNITYLIIRTGPHDKANVGLFYKKRNFAIHDRV